MQSLEARHADRIKRKAENVLQSTDPVRGGVRGPDDTFLEGHDGFDEGPGGDGMLKAGVGIVNPLVSEARSAADVTDFKGATDPHTGDAVDQAHADAAKASESDATADAAADQKVGWPTPTKEGTAQTGSGEAPAA